MRKIRLSQETLKLIACLTMLIDHIGASLFRHMGLRAIGRVSFPIYCFLLCQGFRNTKDQKKYLLRLGISMLLSELPFDLLFYGGFTWAHQSVMVTLFLGLAMAICLEKTRAFRYNVLLIIPFALLAELLHTDYGDMGIYMIALFLLAEALPYKRLLQLAVLIVTSFFANRTKVSPFGLPLSFPLQLFSVFAMVPISLYSGRKVSASPALKWGFYAFYPAHLIILLLIKLFFL